MKNSNRSQAAVVAKQGKKKELDEVHFFSFKISSRASIRK
jgi:hypothetical protein